MFRDGVDTQKKTEKKKKKNVRVRRVRRIHKAVPATKSKQNTSYGLLLTYGLATRHACYAPATRRLLARYSPSIYMCGSHKTRRYLLNKSSKHDNLETKYKTSKQRFICRSRIPTPGCQSMRKYVEVYRLQFEKNPHNTCMENT